MASNGVVAHTLTLKNINPGVDRVNYAVQGPMQVRSREIAEELKQPVCAVDMASNGDVAHTLTLKNINPNIHHVNYAVRGPMLIRAEEIAKELQQGVPKPFTRLIKANIGDGQAMGQPPITFIREVAALVVHPPLLELPHFPSDAKQRAREILAVCEGGSAGSYSDKRGIELIRRHVAEYIERRDGFPSDYKNVVMTAGTTDAIKSILKLFIKDIDGKTPGVMIPIPQYPLYSATLGEYGIAKIEYYLDESKDWGLDMADLQRAIDEARKRCNPRAIVIINPGNPTGQVLSRDNIQEIIKFAYAERLFILADEVYQDNVYAKGSQFHSFKKVINEMGPPYNQMELASFMSCSKGYMSECGLRGGYVEVVNLLPEVLAMYYKLMTAVSCPTVIGQTVLDCVVRPPQPGDQSYAKYLAEKTEVLAALAERAKLVADAFNSVEGVSCNAVQGAMYAFPQIRMPAKAIAKAEQAGEIPDAFYTMALLEATGVCLVPGSGFGQKPGTYHFRTTILPPPETLKEMLGKFKTFHEKFLQEYE